MSKISRTPDMFSEPTEALTPHGDVVFVLEVPGRLPSWNQILGMEHWARYQFKAQLAKEFLSSLRALEADSSTKTTCAKNTTSTFSDILALYLRTAQAKRKLKSANKKLAKANVNLLE